MSSASSTLVQLRQHQLSSVRVLAKNGFATKNLPSLLLLLLFHLLLQPTEASATETAAATTIFSAEAQADSHLTRAREDALPGAAPQALRLTREDEVRGDHEQTPGASKELPHVDLQSIQSSIASLSIAFPNKLQNEGASPKSIAPTSIRRLQSEGSSFTYKFDAWLYIELSGGLPACSATLLGRFRTAVGKSIATTVGKPVTDVRMGEVDCAGVVDAGSLIKNIMAGFYYEVKGYAQTTHRDTALENMTGGLAANANKQITLKNALEEEFGKDPDEFVAIAGVISVSPTNPIRENKKKKTNVLIIVLIVLLVIAVVGPLICYGVYSYNKQQDINNQFYEDMGVEMGMDIGWEHGHGKGYGKGYRHGYYGKGKGKRRALNPLPPVFGNFRDIGDMSINPT